MKSKALLAAVLGSAGMMFALTGCAQMNHADMNQGQTASASQAGQQDLMEMNIKNDMNWWGGPIYTGKPALKATAALVRAGGGAENFSFSQALVSMLGQKTVNAEVAKLTNQYGQKNVQNFISGMDFAVKDALKRATQEGITLPQAPADLKGPKLAKALVKAGMAKDGTFWAGHMFDVAISHKLHNLVMSDIEKKANGHYLDKNTHKILNQAMYDVGKALGVKNVKLASLH